MKRSFNKGKRAKQLMRHRDQLNAESANYRHVDEILRRLTIERKEVRHG